MLNNIAFFYLYNKLLEIKLKTNVLAEKLNLLRPNT